MLHNMHANKKPVNSVNWSLYWSVTLSVLVINFTENNIYLENKSILTL